MPFHPTTVLRVPEEAYPVRLCRRHLVAAPGITGTGPKNSIISPDRCFLPTYLEIMTNVTLRFHCTFLEGIENALSWAIGINIYGGLLQLTK